MMLHSKQIWVRISLSRNSSNECFWCHIRNVYTCSWNAMDASITVHYASCISLRSHSKSNVEEYFLYRYLLLIIYILLYAMTTIEVRKNIYVLFSIEDAFCCIFTSLDILLTPFWHIIYQYMYICLLLFVVVLLLYSFSFRYVFSHSIYCRHCPFKISCCAKSSKNCIRIDESIDRYSSLMSCYMHQHRYETWQQSTDLKRCSSLM